MSEEVFLWGDGPLQPEKGVVLHAGLPQVLTGPVVDHVEAQQCLPSLCLHAGRNIAAYGGLSQINGWMA